MSWAQSGASETLGLGQAAPGFTARNQHGELLALSGLRGAPAVIIFYPWAFSSICRDELAAVRRDHDVDVAHPFVVHQLVQEHPGQPGTARPGHSHDDATLFRHGRSVAEGRIAGQPATEEFHPVEHEGTRSGPSHQALQERYPESG